MPTLATTARPRAQTDGSGDRTFTPTGNATGAPESGCPFARTCAALPVPHPRDRKFDDESRSSPGPVPRSTSRRYAGIDGRIRLHLGGGHIEVASTMDAGACRRPVDPNSGVLGDAARGVHQVLEGKERGRQAGLALPRIQRTRSVGTLHSSLREGLTVVTPDEGAYFQSTDARAATTSPARTFRPSSTE